MIDVCRAFCLALAVLFAVSCGSGSPAPKAKNAPGGRPETQAVEGAGAAGHNGSQVRKKIDRVLDRSDERKIEIEKGARAAESK